MSNKSQELNERIRLDNLRHRGASCESQERKLKSIQRSSESLPKRDTIKKKSNCKDISLVKEILKIKREIKASLESDGEEEKTRLRCNNDLKSMCDSRDLHNSHADQQQSCNADRITPAGRGTIKKISGERNKRFEKFDNKKIKKMLKNAIVKCESPTIVEERRNKIKQYMKNKKKKNERKKALEEIKNKLKTEKLMANLRQLNEKISQLSSKKITISKHSKTSNIKNLSTIDRKMLTNLSFSEENSRSHEEITRLYKINKNKQICSLKDPANENNSLYDLKDRQKHNDALEVQEYFGKIMNRGFKSESRDVNHAKKKEESLATKVFKEYKQRKSGKSKKKKFVEKNKRFCKELSRLVETVIKQGPYADQSEKTTSQNKRKGSIGKKKKKCTNHLKKQVFDYKVIFKQENKEGREVSFQLKNLVPKIKLENLTNLEENCIEEEPSKEFSQSLAKDQIDIDKILDKASDFDDEESSDRIEIEDRIKRETDFSKILKNKDNEGKLYKIGSRAKQDIYNEKPKYQQKDFKLEDINTSNDINIFNSQSIKIGVSDTRYDVNEEDLQENRKSDLNEEQGYTKVAEMKEEKKSADSIAMPSQSQKSSNKSNQNSSDTSKEKSSGKLKESDKFQIRNIDDFVNTDLNNKEVFYESEGEDEEDYKNHIRKLLGKKLKSSDSNLKVDFGPFSNHEEELKYDDSTKNLEQDKFNELIEFCNSDSHEKEDQNVSELDHSIDHEINQISSPLQENTSHIEVEEDKESLNKNEEHHSNNDENDQFPEDFTNMLDGNKDKDTEKIFYFSTLNSQDKLENVNELENNEKKRSSTESKLTLEENDKVVKNEEELAKSKHEINMDDMISFDSSANNQNLINPFQNIESYDKDVIEDKNELISEPDNISDHDHSENDQKLFKNASLNHIDSNFDMYDLMDKNDGQEDCNLIIENFEIDHKSENERNSQKEDIIINLEHLDYIASVDSIMTSRINTQLEEYDEIFPVELICNMEDIPSHDSSSIQSEGEVPAESEKSNQQLNLINNSNSNLNELNNVSNNGPEAFMKTDDLIDLFSIDPATGRAKVEEENDNIFGDIENHDYNDTKEDNFEEFYNDLNPFEEIKQHKAIDDFEFEFKDPEIRREIPIEEFNPSSVQIHNNPTKEEKHTLKFKNFEMEKWVDRDVSETSSQRGRTSILSSESNSKVLEII